MTKDHVGHVASTLVNTSSSNDLKRLLNLNNDSTVTSRQIKDVILRTEEEKIMDEEITSLESNDRGIYEGDDDNIENAMVNVAILNSVVTHGDSASYVVNKSDSIPNNNNLTSQNNTLQNQHSLNRYQLRQRSGDGTCSNSVEQSVPKMEHVSTTKNTPSITTTIAKKPSSKSIPVTKSNPKPPRATKRKRPTSGTVVGIVNHAAASVAVPNSNHPQVSFLTASQPLQVPNPCFNSITAVPNPLSNAIDTPQSQQNQTHTFLNSQTEQRTTTVPNTQSYHTSSLLNITDTLVPCPILSPTYESYSESVPNDMQSNNQNDQYMFPVSDQKQRVTFTEPTETRDRSFSIDLDCKFWFVQYKTNGTI
jgi:hypothetical protein